MTQCTQDDVPYAHEGVRNRYDPSFLINRVEPMSELAMQMSGMFVQNSKSLLSAV